MDSGLSAPAEPVCECCAALVSCCVHMQALTEVRAHHKMLLTGTPLQNNLGELFMLMHFLDGSKFGSLEDFEAEFANISHGEQVRHLP